MSYRVIWQFTPYVILTVQLARPIVYIISYVLPTIQLARVIGYTICRIDSGVNRAIVNIICRIDNSLDQSNALLHMPYRQHSLLEQYCISYVVAIAQLATAIDYIMFRVVPTALFIRAIGYIICPADSEVGQSNSVHHMSHRQLSWLQQQFTSCSMSYRQLSSLEQQVTSYVLPTVKLARAIV